MIRQFILSLGFSLLLGLGLWGALPIRASSGADYVLTTADGLALTLSADGRVTGVQVDGQELAAAPAPALILRDLSLAGQVIAPNGVVNPGFEAGLGAWSEVLNQGLDVGVVVSPTRSGTYALAFTNTHTSTLTAGFASKLMPVDPGQRYRLSAWFLSSIGYVTTPSGTPPLMQMEIWQTFQAGNGLYVQWLDGEGTTLGQPQLVAPLHTEATRWRLIRGEITAPAQARQARAILGARISDQTLWVDDVAFVPSPEPDVALAGIVAPCPGQDDCLQQSVIAAGLAITITYTAHDDHIAVHGEVVDSTGTDRALDVSWGVPLAAGGGVWWDDAHTARTITDGGIYAHEISAIYDGWLPMSLYPYAGVQVGGAGLALGLPLDRPQLALLALDGSTGRYSARYHLGISPQAAKIGPRATFDLMLYRFDPSWGFRDVIARHHALDPEVYTSPRNLYAYQGRSQGWYFTAAGAQQVLAEDQAHIYSAQYTAAELHLKLTHSDQPRPTLSQAISAVSDTQSSPHPWDIALGRAVTASAALDPNGDWSLKHLGIFPWAPDWWEVVWAANTDPDLADGLASYLLNWRITPAFTATTQAGAHLDGVQIDNFMSNPTFDLRPQALAASDWSLSYTPHTYQPAVHTGYAQEEYLATLRRYLDENWGSDRGITINFWGLGHPNYLGRYIDGFGSEGQVASNGEGKNFNPEILDYRRAIAYHRPYLFTIQASGVDASQAYTIGQLALLTGVYPGHGPNGSGWDPAADQVISDTAQLVARYWAAGWEPLTYARANSENVWVERFGRAGATSQSEKESGLYFSIHNRSDITRSATITLRTTPLRITDPGAVTLTDIAITQTVPFFVVDGDIRFDLVLGPRQTRIVQLSGGVQQPTATPSPTPIFTPTATRTGESTTRPSPSPTPSPSPSPTPPISPLRVYLPMLVTEGGGIDVSQLVETDDDILGISDLVPGPYAEVMAAGARVVNLAPMNTFFVLWVPDGYESMAARRVMVIAHGHGGTAYREVGNELEFAREHGYAVVAIQWWPGEGDAMVSGQQFYEFMDVALRYMETKYHAQLDKYALRGWSLGSEISYQVTYLDRVSGNNRLALTISQDGGMMPDADNMSVGKEFTRNLYDGVYGDDAFAGTSFYLYSGAEPQIGYMRNTAQVITSFGGVVERLALDVGAGHDGFYRHPPVPRRCAGDLFQADAVMRPEQSRTCP